MAKRKKRGKEKKKKTDDNDGDGDNCSEYIALLQKDKREKIQKKKRSFILQEMTNVCSKKKKVREWEGKQQSGFCVCACFLSTLFYLCSTVYSFFFFFRSTMSISECERRQTCTTSKLLPLPHLMMSRFSLLSSTRPNCKGKKEKKKTREILYVYRKKKKRPD